MADTVNISFQFMSDLYLEFYDEEWVEKEIFTKMTAVAPYLLLLGNIGRPKTKAWEKFIVFCSENFEQVYYVAGSHEYYSLHGQSEKMSDIKLYINEFFLPLGNITLMDKKSVAIKDVLLLGTTLWTYIPKLYYPIMRTRVHDYNRIYFDPEDKSEVLTNISPVQVSGLHRENVNWLRKEINKAKKSKKYVSIIVLTHHLPYPSLIPDKYLEGKLGCFYASDLSSIFKNEIVSHWIYGRIPTSNETILNGTICASNYRGDISNIDENFKWNRSFDIECGLMNMGNKQREEMLQTVNITIDDGKSSAEVSESDRSKGDRQRKNKRRKRASFPSLMRKSKSFQLKNMRRKGSKLIHRRRKGKSAGGSKKREATRELDSDKKEIEKEEGNVEGLEVSAKSKINDEEIKIEKRELDTNSEKKVNVSSEGNIMIKNRVMIKNSIDGKKGIVNIIEKGEVRAKIERMELNISQQETELNINQEETELNISPEETELNINQEETALSISPAVNGEKKPIAASDEKMESNTSRIGSNMSRIGSNMSRIGNNMSRIGSGVGKMGLTINESQKNEYLALLDKLGSVHVAN